MALPHRGLLDRLDRVARLLAGIDLGAIAPATADGRRALREAINRVKNAELELNEVKRLIERVGQESKT